MKLNKELLQNVLSELENQGLTFGLETAYIKQLHNLIEWQSLNDGEKQQKRKDRIKNLRKKLYKDIEEPLLDYEESVVNLYNLLIDFFLNYRNLNRECFLLKRLYLILFIEKEFIDKHYLISQICHVDKSVVNNIFEQISSTSSYIYLEQLYKAFETMYSLIPQTPYRL